MLRRLVIISFLALVLLPWRADMAVARCENAWALAVIHDSYRAMLIETGRQRLDAARTMLVLLGKDDGSQLAGRLARISYSTSEARLARAFRDGGTLARFIVIGGRPPPGLSYHSTNVEFLSGAFLATGCRNTMPQAQQGNQAQQRTPDVSPRTRPEPETRKTDFRSTDFRKMSVFVMAGLSAVLLAALGVQRVLKSMHVRRSRVERQPRVPVSFDIGVVFRRDGQNQRIQVRAMDASAGGMKVDWANPPQVGTDVMLTLPNGERSGKVMWSNAFYAGLMFDEFLTQDDVAQLASLK